jgi:4-diphosphocytidyl-2-C-methyl-D-erythritol kinase
MRFLAPAKINLFLRILSKSNNNYHNLQSIFHMVDLYDEISIKPRSDRKIIVENDDESISKESDLCLRAAQLILDGRELGVTIKVKKNIPVGAGLGGGSSDAATILLALNQIFSLGVNKKTLMVQGLKLGADIPFFINGENAWVEGVGDKISPILIENYSYIFVIPSISISTASIFQDFKLTNKLIPLKIATSFSNIEHDNIGNDLVETIFEKHPRLRELLIWLKEFGDPKISGTGSTLFIKSNDLNLTRLIEKQKPKDTRIISVKGLSVHPHFLTD